MVRFSSAFESPGSTELNTPSPEVLGNEIAELAAQIHVATHRLLLKLRAFDALDGWAAGGFRGTAEWLSWRTGISPGAARERVRVARALEKLPRISAAMERGELSYSKARALTRVADPESERRLLEVALHATAAQVERLVGGWAGLDRVARRHALQAQAVQAQAVQTQAVQTQAVRIHAEQTEAEQTEAGSNEAGHGAEARHEATSHGAELLRTPCRLRLTPDPRTGSWRIRGELEPEVAMVLQRALAMAAEALYRGTPSDTEPLGLPERQAEAMGLLAEAALRAGVEVEGQRTTGRADRFQVILHVSAETREGHVSAETSDGAATAPSTNPQAPAPADPQTRSPADPQTHPPADPCLVCDASRVRVTLAPDGKILDVGRRTRIVPPALRRALELRDGGCAHPHCANRICDAHHIIPWQEGGATSLENLVLLCRRHHRGVHRGEFEVEVQAPGGASHVLFRDAKGEVLVAAPPQPALCDDPVAALRRDHAARGLDPATLAAYPKWDGTPLNLGLALDWLWRPPAAGPPAAHPPAAHPPAAPPPSAPTPGARPPEVRPPEAHLLAVSPPATRPPATRPPGASPPTGRP